MSRLEVESFKAALGRIVQVENKGTQT